MHIVLKSPQELNRTLLKEGKIIMWKNVSSTRLQTQKPSELVWEKSSQGTELVPKFQLWEVLVQPELPAPLERSDLCVGTREQRAFFSGTSGPFGLICSGW